MPAVKSIKTKTISQVCQQDPKQRPAQASGASGLPQSQGNRQPHKTTAANTLKKVASGGNAGSNQTGTYGSTKRLPAASSYGAGAGMNSKSTKKA